MVVFQAITWEARDEVLDEDTIQHHVSIFGKTEDGRSVCVTTQVLPYFYVRLGHAGMSLGRSIYAAMMRDVQVDS